MFVDGILIEKSTKGCKIDFTHCERVARNKWHWITYKCLYKQELTIQYNARKKLLRIEGSIPYFIGGHNLFSNRCDFIRAVNLLSQKLNIDLSDAIIKKFEFGVVLKSIFSIDHQKLLHLDGKSYRVRVYEFGKWFIHRDFMIKLYDAGKTFSRNVKHYVQRRMRDQGIFDPGEHYIKLEVVYKKPVSCFGRQLTVSDLSDLSFNRFLEEDLKEKYNSIIKRTPYKIPNNKVDLDCLSICICALFELLSTSDHNPGLYLIARTNDIPRHILNKFDKSNRRRTFRKYNNKLLVLSIPQWDLIQENKEPFWFSPYIQTNSSS